MAKAIRIQLVRGLAGKRKAHIETLKALGLKRRLQIVEKPATPEVLGQVNKISYLLQVEEIS